MSRQPQQLRTRNAATFVGALAIVGVMSVAVSYSVELYQWFCQVTGFGGTTQVAEAAPGTVSERSITIRFNADVNPKLPWRFKPVQKKVSLRLGEQGLAFYQAKNISARAVTGTATFNVTPAKAGPYFSKIECFCFTEQRLEPGQSIDMPVTFFVDPDLAKDRNLNGVTEITLSYTFFRSLEDVKDEDDNPSKTAQADDGKSASVN